MDLKPRNIGKGKGRANLPRNRHHPGFSGPAAASSSTSTDNVPSASSTVSRDLDPELAAKKEAQAAVKAVNAARRAQETERLAARADAEIVRLLEMSLSDWAVDHAGTGLRMKLKSADGGFISLDWLMRTSAVLEHLPALYQQPAEVLKALKSCPSDIVELRMSLDQGSTFEIRRKTPLTTERAEPADVLARTVYAENLSPRANTMHGLLGSLMDLVPYTPGKPSIQSIQVLKSPKETQDRKKPARIEHVRIVLESNELADALAGEWTWRPAVLYGGYKEDVELKEQADKGDWKARSRREATLVGFRTLPWVEFEKRREEYLEYQKRMVPPPPGPKPTATPGASAVPGAPGIDASGTTEPRESQAIPPHPTRALYPQGCLVFVKNVPTDTNKTALKETFNNLLGEGETVDYVDWEKGLDTCHVRTSTPEKASKIHAECSSRVIKVPSNQASLGIKTEVVQGTREEIYWMALPVKIRDGAVRSRDGVTDEPAAKRRRRG